MSVPPAPSRSESHAGIESSIFLKTLTARSANRAGSQWRSSVELIFLAGAGAILGRETPNGWQKFPIPNNDKINTAHHCSIAPINDRIVRLNLLFLWMGWPVRRGKGIEISL